MIGSIARLVALALVCAFFAVRPVSAEQVERGTEPRWVDRLPLPAPRHERMRQVQSGLYYLLLDTQVRSVDGVENYYTRSAYQVIDRGGLEEAARLEIEFNPSREHVVFHGITLWRHGIAYDRLRDAEIQVLHREQDLDKGIIDGRKTVHIEIKDVEVGDVVDYSYSWVADNDPWPQDFFGHATAAWSVPLEVWRYRVIRPSGTPLAIRNRNSRVAPTVASSGSNTIYEWRLRDPDPVSDETDVPKWFPRFGAVAISSMTSWAEVVASMLPLYSGKDTLPPQLAVRVAAAMANDPKAEDRITWALHLVEDEFRYVSMSIDGSGSYSPRTPTAVQRSGYGDCKDKSQLLVALLRAMGIDAAVALTDIETGRALPEEVPAPTLFGHAIVQVRLNGRSYWLDPTGSFEGGRFPNIATATYGWALPLRREQTRLEPIPEATAPVPTYRTTERYELARGDNPRLTLTVETAYLDGDADWMRSDMASKSQAQIEGDYLDFYAKMYPGIVRERPIQVTDDRARNRIVVREAYALSPAALTRRKLAAKFMVKASSMNDYDKVPNGRRETPYELNYPVNKQHTIVLVTPGRRPPAPEPVALENAGFRYTMDVVRNDDTLTLNYRMVGKKRFLAADEVAEASDDADAVSDDDYWYLDLTSTAGGTIGSKTQNPVTWTELVVEVLAVIGALALIGLAVLGVRRGLHDDDGHAAQGVFYPVTIRKFLVMNIATGGLYAFFWMWKCWRWLLLYQKRPVEPFWRSVFSVIWLYPLFSEARRRGRIPLVLQGSGLIAAGAYILWVSAAAGLGLSGGHQALVIALTASSFLCFLPTVIAINRLNAKEVEVVRRNSQNTVLTSAALVCGLLNWAALAGLPLVHIPADISVARLQLSDSHDGGFSLH